MSFFTKLRSMFAGSAVDEHDHAHECDCGHEHGGAEKKRCNNPNCQCGDAATGAAMMNEDDCDCGHDHGHGDAMDSADAGSDSSDGGDGGGSSD